jgi:hypothetical protein
MTQMSSVQRFVQVSRWRGGFDFTIKMKAIQ